VKKIIYLHSGLEDDIGGPHATVILWSDFVLLWMTFPFNLHPNDSSGTPYINHLLEIFPMKYFFYLYQTFFLEISWSKKK
jgi:hypothetical protein